MDAAIREIVQGVPSGLAFDAHYVIDTLIRNYSDTYILFARTISAQSNVTPYLHSEISKKIDRLNGSIIDRQQNKSYSYNIRGNASDCVQWIKR